ncbi:MAG TPA: amidohydrolase family protein [Bacteroidales bacterium]|nr:amidohydrolase family protein [Bacteroidales bacterium]
MTRIPLLKDNHNHLFTYSVLNTAENLFYVKNKNKALQTLKELAPENVNVVIGWFDSFYSFSEAELESLPPVIICNNSLHKYVFNKKAEYEISKDYSEWVENNNNQIWVEKNLRKILAYLSELFSFNKNTLDLALKKNLNAGVCFTADMFVASNNIFNLLSEIDFYAYTEIWTNPDIYPNLQKKYKDLCRGVKLFTDGAIGASSAAIYGYKTSEKGLLIYTDKDLLDKLVEISEFKKDIAIHCIGDIAIEQVLSSLSKILKRSSDIKVRLEHAQFITKKQAFIAKDLGLILSMQPNFNMDSVIYSDRLTQHYCETNNPFRMLIDSAGFVPGKDLIFGSDGMPTGIAGAIQDSLFPPVSGQKISLDEFVAAYCTNDFEQGFINVHIDNLKKKVITDVII